MSHMTKNGDIIVYFNKRQFAVLYIPVGNLRSLGLLAPYAYLHWFHEFCLGVSSLIVTTSAFVKKGKTHR